MNKFAIRIELWTKIWRFDSIFWLICIQTSLVSGSIDVSNQSKELRILQLLPRLTTPLAIEPMVPDNFVAMSPNGVLDPYDWIYWGPKNVLEEYFKNPDSLQQPVLRVKLSANVCQTGPKSFNGGTTEEVLSGMKQIGECKFTEQEWDSYYVLETKTKADNQILFIAWVGVNNPVSKAVVMFNLVYPNTPSHPDDSDVALWDNFLSGTKQLSEPDFFKAHGLDMQPGYTITNSGGAKLIMNAESRKKDGRIQLVVKPLSENTKFTYEDMEKGLKGNEWKKGEPMLIVYGTTLKQDKNYSISNDQSIPIFIQSVEEFSVDKDNCEPGSLLFQESF